MSPRIGKETSLWPHIDERPAFDVDSTQLRRRPKARTTPSSPTAIDKHPLNENEESHGESIDVFSDVSRPRLREVIGKTERHVAESSRSESETGGSNRGSLDTLRMTPADSEAREVEVLIHQIKPAESIAGIALLYGIDVSTLRKVNKLWPSDPVHLRTHLYVPLDACKWNHAGETLIRGPGEGRVTIVSKSSGKHTGSEDPHHQLSGTRVVDVVRIPASQLSFFPKSRGRPRTSLDVDLRRSSLSVRRLSLEGSTITNNLTTLPPPLQTYKPSSHVVRLRPPTSTRTVSMGDSSSIASRISHLFAIPPPPLPPDTMADDRKPTKPVVFLEMDYRSDTGRGSD